MILIVGLGNPGKKYEKTRHNIGFMTVESLKLKFESFSNWQNIKKLLSEISQGEIYGQKVILAKPQTFMNNSGKAVKSLIQNYCNKKAMAMILQYLWVIHDELDLPLGKIRISVGRGAAGHKGVESIMRELKTKNFVRFRIGINPNSTFNHSPFSTGWVAQPKILGCGKIQKSKLQLKRQDFVLENFNKKEEKIVKDVIKKAVEAIEFSLKEGIEKAMQKYNK